MRSAYPSVTGSDIERQLTWSPAEKSVARKAFDLALHGELDEVINETKTKAAKIRQASDVWDLERYLTKRRSQIDRRFDYRYSVLVQVFGELLHRGRLSEQDLHGLSEDKLDAIRRYASFLNSPLASNSRKSEF